MDNTTTADDVATIKLEEGETVTCRYVNTFPTEGCTPGFWKNHLENWDEGAGGSLTVATDDQCSPFSTAGDFTTNVEHCDFFNASMGVTDTQSPLSDSATLDDAINLGGGGKRALTRHASAALASADSGINFGFSVQDVIDIYRDGVGADAGPLSVQQALSILSTANMRGCPLN